MVAAQSEVWWADLAHPIGPAPGYRRPVVVIQSDPLNRSQLATVVCVVLTSNLRWSIAPGNVLLHARQTGLDRDSVANVSQIVTIGARRSGRGGGSRGTDPRCGARRRSPAVPRRAEAGKSPLQGVRGVSGNRLRTPRPLPTRTTSRSSPRDRCRCAIDRAIFLRRSPNFRNAEAWGTLVH